MITHEYTIEIPDYNQAISIYGLTDFHAGNKTFDEGNLRDTIAEIQSNPFARTFLLGDLCEFIGRLDKRFAMEAIPDRFIRDMDNLFMAQADYVIELLLPIADKIIGMHGGNHEEAILRYHSFDPHAYIVARLSEKLGRPIVNLGYGAAFTRLKIKRGKHSDVIIFHTAHGTGGGEYKGAKANRLQRLLAKFQADIYLRGHTHELFAFNQPAIGIPRKGELKVISE